MKKAVLLLLSVLVLAGCQGSPANTDGYVRNHEPKTGGADL
jgi:PBP1b-binding outer membrane lipoprotein LpoB